jgi:hypothetical protein
MSDEELDELIGPVCFLADLRTNEEARRKGRNRYPDDLDELIRVARKVKAGYGFNVITMSLKD